MNKLVVCGIVVCTLALIVACGNGPPPASAPKAPQAQPTQEAQRPLKAADPNRAIEAIKQKTERVKKLLAEVRDPSVEIVDAKAVQQGDDVVVRGKGRNAGETALATLYVWAKVGDEVDGIMVTASGRPAFEIPVGDDFEFELNMYYARKTGPVTIWFTLHGLDGDKENDVPVPAKLNGRLQNKITLE